MFNSFVDTIHFGYSVHEVFESAITGRFTEECSMSYCYYYIITITVLQGKGKGKSVAEFLVWLINIRSCEVCEDHINIAAGGGGWVVQLEIPGETNFVSSGLIDI